MKSESRVESVESFPVQLSNEGLNVSALSTGASHKSDQTLQFDRNEDSASFYIRCSEIPTSADLIELALARPAEGEKPLRLVTHNEIPILQRYAPFDNSWLGGIEGGRASIGPTETSITIASLSQMSQLLGPLDHTLFGAGNGANEEWIASREDKFRSIIAKIAPELSFNGDSSRTVFERALMLKEAALELLSELPLPDHRMIQASADPIDMDRFGYVEGLRTRLGSNLSSVLAYGSSIGAPVGAPLKDYDNILVVADVQSAMRELQHWKLTWQGVPVHSSVVPATALGHFLLMNYAPGTDHQSYRVISGTAQLPHVDAPLLAEMGIQGVVSLCISRRTSLLSKLIRDADLFIERVRESAQAMGFVEAFSVMPLTKIGWLIQFINDPGQQRLPKREAAERVVQEYGLPPINPVLKDAKLLAAAQTDQVRLALAESIRTIHFALTRFSEEVGASVG